MCQLIGHKMLLFAAVCRWRRTSCTGKGGRRSSNGCFQPLPCFEQLRAVVLSPGQSEVALMHLQFGSAQIQLLTPSKGIEHNKTVTKQSKLLVVLFWSAASPRQRTRDAVLVPQLILLWLALLSTRQTNKLKSLEGRNETHTLHKYAYSTNLQRLRSDSNTQKKNCKLLRPLLRLISLGLLGSPLLEKIPVVVV